MIHSAHERTMNLWLPLTKTFVFGVADFLSSENFLGTLRGIAQTTTSGSLYGSSRSFKNRGSHHSVRLICGDNSAYLLWAH